MGDRSPMGNVLKFERRMPGAFVRLKPYGKRAPHCEHNDVYLDPNNRTVECVRCGAVLDPFNFLIGIMRDGERLMQMYAMIEQVSEGLESLYAEERKVKQRVRDWRAKLPTAR